MVPGAGSGPSAARCVQSRRSAKPGAELGSGRAEEGETLGLERWKGARGKGSPGTGAGGTADLGFWQRGAWRENKIYRDTRPARRKKTPDCRVRSSD